ncbi:MAG TPA: helix-turn-helix transcriptional regulator [Clostridiales bacterium]|jgi:transcriptional regulator with XRE-family HTH domain|nr:helix-turn-helix transcriptional regulator [Clostridiales bacterium]
MGKKFAKKLQELMDRNMLTPSELAKKLNLSRMMIYQYLNEISLPSKERLPAMAKVLGCDDQELSKAAFEDYKEKRIKRRGF